PGLGIATLGPGATNLATGVGSAWLDRSPMIAITCNLNTDQLGRRIQMYIDHQQLFAPITKVSIVLREGSVAESVAKAVRLSLTEPMGPVHLDLPEDVAVAMATETLPELVAPVPVAAADDAEIQAALAVLAEAARPVAILGTNAMRMHDIGLLQGFIERHGIPFASTTMTKGLIDEDHPLSIGCIERSKRQIQRAFLRGADLIVGLGYDTIEVEYEAWIGDTPLLQIDIEKVDVAPSVQLKAEVTGNLDTSIAALAEADVVPNDWQESDVATHGEAFEAGLRPEV
ncbi:MAG: thiamine pyrophosphate-binding protein, partial [Alphaproteobacteria bacterium]